MKITKTKLKQINKEELSVVLNEQQGDLGFPEEEAPPAEWRVGPDLSPEEKQEQIVFEKEHYPALSDKVQGLRDRYGAEARIIEDPKGPVIAVWWLEEDDQEEDAEIFDSVEEAIEMLEKGANHWVGRSTRRYLGSEK